MRKKQDIMWEQSTLWESVEEWVTKYLKKNHSEYRELQVKAMRIVEENPTLRILINSMEGIVLTPEDHKALHKYIETKDEMTIFEYEYYYLAGQMMTFSYGRMLAQLKKEIYTKKTQEEENGKLITITADFRKYPSIEDSIADHSAYLLGAKNGSTLRYHGLKGCTDYKKAAQIIKDGGYATSSTYVQRLCEIIEKWELTKYNADSNTKEETSTVYYRVRKTWADAKSQLGAYKILANAKKCADEHPGYSVFDGNGVVVYAAKQQFTPYIVQVKIADLNIRKGPGTNYAKWGRYTGIGAFTIMDEADGPGATKWGLLKSYMDKRNGWISLDFATKC